MLWQRQLLQHDLRYQMTDHPQEDQVGHGVAGAMGVTVAAGAFMLLAQAVQRLLIMTKTSFGKSVTWNECRSNSVKLVWAR